MLGFKEERRSSYMDELEEEVPFIAQIRSAGKSKSLILTIPREVCKVVALANGDYVKMKVKKLRLEKV